MSGTGLYEQIAGDQAPKLPSHEVGAVWRIWVEGTFDANEMWGNAVLAIPPKMEWTPQTRIDLESMQAHYASGLGQPQQAQYFTVVESVFVAWMSPLELLTQAQGESLLF